MTHWTDRHQKTTTEDGSDSGETAIESGGGQSNVAQRKETRRNTRRWVKNGTAVKLHAPTRFYSRASGRKRQTWAHLRHSYIAYGNVSA